MEDNFVTISRLNASITYPCNFMFVASMNPCPCGYYGLAEKKCSCRPDQIKKYINRISGPLLDRIDIHIEVTPIKYEKLNNTEKTESSEDIRKRVNNARQKQIERYKEYNIFSNSELMPSMTEKFCELNSLSKKLLKNAFQKLNISTRAYGKILKVARTIADLDNSEYILENHIAEAIQYRTLDRKYWKY